MSGMQLSFQLPSAQSNEMDQGPMDKDANGGSLLKRGKGTPEGGLGLVSWEKDQTSPSPVFVYGGLFAPAVCYK